MTESRIRELLEAVRAGNRSVDETMDELRSFPHADLGYATVDHHRAMRVGFPEVILGSCKTPEQIAGILVELARGGGNILVTRVDPDRARRVAELVPAVEHHEAARALVLRQGSVPDRGRGAILIITAGTGDIPVAEEALLTAELMGNRVERIYDVGVAGIHRILTKRERLAAASVIVVVAGMEGALASVVGGLVPKPIIAVPTSVGYGASFGGLAALLGMLNSCAAGVSVVNIDNGFGAGYAAALINRRDEEPR
jgi:pyridinium-3,5-biscarboxylic acid mononucleotide synthase